MKKYRITIIKGLILFFASVMMVSCEQECFTATFDPNDAKTTFILTLNTSEMSSRSLSRAEAPGDNTYHENDIDWVDVFFYPEGSEESNALYAERIAVNKNASTNIQVRISSLIEEDLFPDGDGDECTVYIIANYPSVIIKKDADTKLSTLKSLALETAFNTLDFTATDANFVMDGQSKAKLNKPDNGQSTVSGTVDLYRAASKIALFATVSPTIEVKDENGVTSTWRSHPGSMKISFHNGVNKAYVDVTSLNSGFNPESYFQIEKRDMSETADQNDGNTYTHVPFYSYSSDWNKPTATETEAYLTLMLPWSTGTEGSGNYMYRTCYYQIPVNTLTKSMVRNNYYKINLTVAMLGSFVKEEWVDLNPRPSYTILDWSTNQVSAALRDFRYLMVEKNYIEVYNQNKVTIPFATSHNAEIVSISCSKPNLKTINPNDVTNVTLDDSQKPKIDGTDITYEKKLDNNFFSDSFDFVPYTVTFRIRHIDNNDFYQDITIVQYPAVYGVAEVNSDYYNTPGDPNSGTSGKNDEKGYVWVNGYQEGYNNTPPTGVNSNMYFASVTGMSSSSIANPTMYVITVTSVKGTNYVIGDPREVNLNTDILKDTYGTNKTSVWKTAPVLLDNGTKYGTVDKNNQRVLKHYYATDANPTNKENDRTYNMLAPKFRLASAYAVLYTNADAAKSLEGMKKRCASYQEDGYPAGRWRMPTKAEFEFIFSLSNRGFLGENIYDKGDTYWCAHGLGTPQADNTVSINNATTSSGNSIRCVYDEWYWTDKLPDSEKDTFTWGDRPR